MGKTKVKIIDDAQQKEEVQKPSKQAVKKEDKLVARLKEELGVKKERKQKLDVEGGKLDEEVRSFNRSKKYQQAILQVDRNQKYPLKDAVELAQKTSYSKFPGTLEAHINTTAKNIRVVVSLPYTPGKIEVKSEPNGQVIHLAIGKLNQSADEITANIKSLYQTIGKSKINKITLSPTMGPGVKVDLAGLDL